MRHLLAAVVTAIEAAAIALIGVAIVGVPAVLVWIVSFTLSSEPIVVIGGVAAVWALGHGIPLTFALEPELALSLGLEPNELTFVFSLIPLGLSLVTILFGARMGWTRRGTLGQASIALLGGTLGFAAAATAIAVFAEAHIAWSLPLTVSIATLFFAVPAWTLLLVKHPEAVREGITRAAASATGSGAPRIAGAAIRLLPRVLRLAAALLAAVTGLAAVAVTVAVVGDYPEVVRLSQELQLDVVGIVVVFMLQLVYLPTLLVWALAWLAGAGFAIGAGSSVTAFEVLLGPIPTLPLFGAIPDGWGTWGFLSIVTVVFTACAVGFVFGDRAEYRNPSIWATLGVGAVASIIVGALFAALAALSSGSLGPGRLETTGISVWWFSGALAGELLVGVLGGLALRRIDRPKLFVTRPLDRPVTDVYDDDPEDTQATVPLDGLSRTESWESLEPTEALRPVAPVERLGPLDVPEPPEPLAPVVSVPVSERGAPTVSPWSSEEPTLTQKPEKARESNRKKKSRRRRREKPPLDFSEEALLEEYSWDADPSNDPGTSS